MCEVRVFIACDDPEQSQLVKWASSRKAIGGQCIQYRSSMVNCERIIDLKTRKPKGGGDERVSLLSGVD